MSEHVRGLKNTAPLKCGRYLTQIISAGFGGGKVTIDFQVKQLRVAHIFRVAVAPSDWRGRTELNGLASIAGFSYLDEMLNNLDCLLGMDVTTTIWMLDPSEGIPLATRYAWVPPMHTNSLPIMIDG